MAVFEARGRDDANLCKDQRTASSANIDDVGAVRAQCSRKASERTLKGLLGLR